MFVREACTPVRWRLKLHRYGHRSATSLRAPRGIPPGTGTTPRIRFRWRSEHIQVCVLSAMYVAVRRPSRRVMAGLVDCAVQSRCRRPSVSTWVREGPLTWAGCAPLTGTLELCYHDVIVCFLKCGMENIKAFDICKYILSITLHDERQSVYWSRKLNISLIYMFIGQSQLKRTVATIGFEMRSHRRPHHFNNIIFIHRN